MMMDQSLKLLALGLCLAVTTACGDDSGGDDETGTPTTTDDGTTTDGPTTTANPTTEGQTTMDEPTTTEGADDTMGDETDGGGACPGVPDSGAAAGEACTASADCESGVCALFQDVPADDDAVCGEVVADCNTRFTGVARDFVTREGIGNQEIRVIGAISALSMAATADPAASGDSDAEGIFDFTSAEPINAAIAIVAVITGGDYFTTATGAASPVEGNAYGPANAIHEFWGVPTSSLAAWTTGLEGLGVTENLPLGEAGGVVGFVRDADGNPVAGATVTPAGDSSGATVYYPQSDDSVVETMTDDSGLFVILGASGGGEDFNADAGGLTGTGTAGSGANVVFTLVMVVE